MSGTSRRVIAIDGPAASGKSTAARGVAEALGFRHLNSGLLYRAVTWAALREGWEEEGSWRRRLERLRLELMPSGSGFRVRVAGRDPGRELFGRDVTARVSSVASRGCVRRRVTRLVRESALCHDLVCDGRDVGTAIFPDAELKVFLVASPGERARRRLSERGEEAVEGRLREEVERIRRRDALDSKRAIDPLRRAPDALELDTTELSAREVVDRIVEEACRRGMV